MIARNPRGQFVKDCIPQPREERTRDIWPGDIKKGLQRMSQDQAEDILNRNVPGYASRQPVPAPILTQAEIEALTSEPDNLADRIDYHPTERDDGKFTSQSKRAEETATRQATTAALRRDVAAERHWTSRLAEWCVTNTTKYLLICAAIFWGLVLLAIAGDVFVHVVQSFWDPTGRWIDLAIAGAGEWIAR